MQCTFSLRFKREIEAFRGVPTAREFSCRIRENLQHRIFKRAGPARYGAWPLLPYIGTL